MVCSERSLVVWIFIAGTLFVAAITLQLVSVIIERFYFARDHAGNYWMKSDVQNFSCQRLSHIPAFSNNSLDFLSKIYVISLPRRTDRRFQMDFLQDVLHLNWTYRDACEANEPVVSTILRQVHVLRSQSMPQSKPEDVRTQNGGIVSKFDWPRDLEDTICSHGTLQPSGADLWTLPSSFSLSNLTVPAEAADLYASTYSPSVQALVVSDSTPLACTSENNVFATFSPKLPLHRRLTAAKVACWYSHFRTIREIANGKDEAALVLEDDIDIERDVKMRLQPLLDALPSDWDIVYLGTSTSCQAWTAPDGPAGHCWSNESQFPSLRSITLRLPSGRMAVSGLYPANSPKCTHAYMLSRIGARRIVAHLRHPPFAYSRAIDQALAWLTQSGRLRAFSIVPSVVVQRKVVVSDVMPGLGSAWRDALYNGVFGGVDDDKEPKEHS